MKQFYILLGFTVAVSGLDPDAVMRAGPGVKPPQLVHKVEPNYTREAREHIVQGKVLVEFAVDTSGLPANIVVLRPLGFGLDEQAVRAMKEWRFSPGTNNGQTVPVYATVEFNFGL